MNLDDYQPAEYAQYKRDISLLHGNILMQFQLPSIRDPQQPTYLSFKSGVIQSWAKDWPLKYAEYDYVNFFLNYMESNHTMNKGYHHRFLTGLYECQQRSGSIIPQNNMFNFKVGKNIKENMLRPDIVSEIDELILVVSFNGMYFLYVIWLSVYKCFILDVQNGGKGRFHEHVQLVTELLRKEFRIQRNQELKSLLLKEFQFKSLVAPILRSGLIMSFVNKYIRNLDDAYKIERVKISMEDSHDILDRLTWFVYKCYREKQYLGAPQPQQKYENKVDISFKKWEEERRFHQEIESKDIMNEKKQMFRSQLIDDKQRAQMEKIWKLPAQSSFFSKVASSQIVNGPEIVQSVGLNRFKATEPIINNGVNAVVVGKAVGKQGKEIRADDFMKNAAYREIPKYRLEDSERSISVSMEHSRLSRGELQEQLDRAKREIKEDLEKEFQRRQEEWLKEQEKMLSGVNERNRLDNEIVEEYMTQIKFKRYQEYLQYLLSYYYNYQPEAYQQLVDEYHNRLKAVAMDGIVGMQKKEMEKLISLTKEKVLQQNQQIDLVHFNQQRVMEKINQQKMDLKKKERNKIIEDLERRKKPQHVYQFSKPQEVNPYQFLDENVMGQNEQEQQAREKYDYQSVDMSDNDVKHMFELWDFDYYQKQQMRKEEQQRKEEEERQRIIDEHDSFESEQGKMQQEIQQMQDRLKVEKQMEVDPFHMDDGISVVKSKQSKQSKQQSQQSQALI